MGFIFLILLAGKLEWKVKQLERDMRKIQSEVKNNILELKQDNKEIKATVGNINLSLGKLIAFLEGREMLPPSKR